MCSTSPQDMESPSRKIQKPALNILIAWTLVKIGRLLRIRKPSFLHI